MNNTNEVKRTWSGKLDAQDLQDKMNRLYFLQDLSMGSKTVYSGHSGTGKKFQMYQGDYGKYAMKPATFAACEALKAKIEKDAKGTVQFKWNIVPCTEIDLCNFYSDAEFDAFEALKIKQKELFAN